MAEAIKAIKATIDAAQVAIDRLSNIDMSPLGRKLTAKAFMAEAIKFGATAEGIAAIETAIDKPTATALQRAWLHPYGLRAILIKDETSRPLGRLGPFMLQELKDALAPIGAQPQDWQGYIIKRLAKEHPECFGTATGPDQTAAKIGEGQAARDRAFDELMAVWLTAEAAVTEFGLKPQWHHRAAVGE